ncbi:hypothetical protein AB0K09_15875 [Streptomyces sp. NPDC049577]|uniref:hypothetical protein n=1 Tax=Streptomyces sp. NPDC049577 TaxID=3155153 RepID=UPI00342E93DB
MPTSLMERIRNINWDDGEASYDHAASRAALLREHLRRTALWARAFNLDIAWPYFDLAGLIDPAVRADDKILAELRDCLGEEVGWPQVEATLIAAAHWHAFLDRTQIELPDLEDPYEPLLVMYERGGAFTMESDFIELNGETVPIRPLPDHASPQPVVALEPAALNALDEESTAVTEGTRPPHAEPVHPLVAKRHRMSSDWFYEFCAKYGVDDPDETNPERAAEYKAGLDAIYTQIRRE